MRIELEAEEGRFSRFNLIGWWDQERLAAARVLVLGAGALGNEILKNLALLGVGRVLVVDMDRIERSNLARSVLFREGDEGRFKAEVAAERLRDIHPGTRVVHLSGNALTDVGLGLYADSDLVIGGLDNREALLAANRACWLLDKPWIDGAIEVLQGVARVFHGPEGACYECTMGERDWKLVQERRSCALLGRDAVPERHVPTTPTMASIVAGIQCQEAVKHLHGLPGLRGAGFVYDGTGFECYRVGYTRSGDCLAHDRFDRLLPLGAGAAGITAGGLLDRVRSLMGGEAVVDLPGDLVTSFRCSPCGREARVMRRLELLREGDALCPNCGEAMAPEILSTLDGSCGVEDLALSALGIPPRDILRCRSGDDYAGAFLDGDPDPMENAQ